MDSQDESQDEPFVIVPPEALSPDALQGLLEEFVTREGTDYGPREFTLEQKVAAVRQQVSRGEVVIVFEPASGTVTLSLRDRLPSPAAR